MSLEHTSALVTGGASGMGEATARRLTGDGHLGLAMDVADTENVVQGVAHAVEAAGPIDILINVAGWDRFVPFVYTTREFWDQVIAVNYRGPLNTAHAVVPSMIERRLPWIWPPRVRPSSHAPSSFEKAAQK